SPSFQIALHRVPAPLWLVVGAAFHYIGPAFAVLLFPSVGVLGVALVRIVTAALLFACWSNPIAFLRAATPQKRRLIVALGVCLAAMNCSFYMALDRAPLGFVAALELTGSLAVAATGLRSQRNVVAFALAAAGAVYLMRVQSGASLAGLAWACLNAAFWVGYLLLAYRVANDERPAANLGAAMAVAAICVLPLGGPHVLRVLANPVLLAAAAGVGICSSVIPYVCDQLAMRRVARQHFALMLTLMPVWAAVVGLLVLGQTLTRNEWLGVMLVVAGLSLHRPAVQKG
ncbi:MAG: EamA family transporter, partial [Telluria sp.]